MDNRLTELVEEKEYITLGFLIRRHECVYGGNFIEIKYLLPGAVIPKTILWYVQYSQELGKRKPICFDGLPWSQLDGKLKANILRKVKEILEAL